MNPSPATFLKAVLLGADLVGLPGTSWPAYISFMAKEPHNAVALYDELPVMDGRLSRSAGSDAGVDRVHGEVIQHPRVQILLRALKFEDGWERMDRVRAVCDQVRNQATTVGDVTYVLRNIVRASGPVPVGLDDNSPPRSMFSLNLVLTFDPNPT